MKVREETKKILTDAKVFGSLFEQRIDDFFALDYFRFQGCGSDFALALFGAFDDPKGLQGCIKLKSRIKAKIYVFESSSILVLCKKPEFTTFILQAWKSTQNPDSKVGTV